MKQYIFNVSILCLIFSATCAGQYPPPAGYPGTTAIHKDSANWVCWANAAAQIQLGYKDISNPGGGYAAMGVGSDALGMAGEGGTISLGDGGRITLQFPYAIKNGAGSDFAVFENSFSNTFLELAFVEVSSDGQHFVRFPAISETDTGTQVNGFGSVDATKIHNLAGKYRAGYGTPFDLEDLIDSSGIDLQQITHLRLVDVVGSINPVYAGRDSRGFIINDPFPTPFDSGGFDLDAVGVLNADLSSPINYFSMPAFSTYPNPVTKAESLFTIDFGDVFEPEILQVHDLQGRLVFNKSIYSKEIISTKNWPSGIYIVSVKQSVVKIFVL